MSLTNRFLVRDLLVITIISLLILAPLNFIFVYYSPTFIKMLPSKLVRSISPCYRTLYHHDGESLHRTNFVFGDSFTEGFGDEFLSSDPEYGIFNKLKNVGVSELIFGRGGYGNIGTVIEFEQCYPLLSSFTSLLNQDIKRYHVTFVFYEGNDLNNNLVENGREVNKFLYKLRFLFPVYELIYKQTRKMLGDVYRKLQSEKENTKGVFPITSSGIKIPAYPQSAATELSDIQVKSSLSLLFTSLDSIKKSLPNAESFMILYLPSVASSYSFEGDIRVHSYNGQEYFQTTGKFNSDRNSYIYDLVQREGIKNGWYTCDTTSTILNISNNGVAVHGPIDWKHFNKIGYTAIAESYDRCLSSL